MTEFGQVCGRVFVFTDKFMNSIKLPSVHFGKARAPGKSRHLAGHSLQPAVTSDPSGGGPSLCAYTVTWVSDLLSD